MYSNSLVCKILIYIDENFYSKITIEDLENNFFYNRYYIMKLFKKEIGLTIVEYINSIKIYKSIEYIKNSNNSLINISIKSGFYSLEYFSETFKKITGLNPYSFKKYFKRTNISDNAVSQIQHSIIYLYEINNIKNKYLSKQKPKEMLVKKISIFK